jgi:signal peptidase I
MSGSNIPPVVVETIKWIEAVIFAVLLALIIRGFLIEPVLVQGESMEKTLFDSQRLVIYKLSYFYSLPKHGDIVVLRYQGGAVEKYPFLKNIPNAEKVFPSFTEIDYVKRVIGLPGDLIDIKDGFVYLNGKKLDEPYAVGITEKKSIDLPLMVPENNAFVLGDNRQNSRDSREIGCIKLKDIKGKAVLRMWPIKNFGLLYR